MTGFEARGETVTGITLDDTNLSEPPRELRRRLHVARQRLRPLRQGRVGAIACNLAPVHGRRWIDRSVQVVAERGAQRLLVAFLHRNVVDDRRPQTARPPRT